MHLLTSTQTPIVRASHHLNRQAGGEGENAAVALFQPDLKAPKYRLYPVSSISRYLLGWTVGQASFTHKGSSGVKGDAVPALPHVEFAVQRVFSRCTCKSLEIGSTATALKERCRQLGERIPENQLTGQGRLPGRTGILIAKTSTHQLPERDRGGQGVPGRSLLAVQSLWDEKVHLKDSEKVSIVGTQKGKENSKSVCVF